MRTISDEELKKILEEHNRWLNTCTCKGSRADLSGANLRDANLSYANLAWIKTYYTKGDIVTVSGQGNEFRSITLNKKQKTAFIGCFRGTFDEARTAIRERYGDKAEAVTGGYGLTLMAMEAIEKEGGAQ